MKVEGNIIAYTYKCSITGEVFENITENRKSWNKSKYLIQGVIDEDREQDNREKKEILREYKERESARKKVEKIVQEDSRGTYHIDTIEDYEKNYKDRLLRKYWEEVHKRMNIDEEKRIVQDQPRSNKDIERPIDDNKLSNTEGMMEV